jgi:hypothetical protein
MKRAVVILAITISSLSLIFSDSCLHKGESYPEEYRLDVPHVSDQQESTKYGPRIGGHCYLACATMLMKYFDPAIEFWEVLVSQENTTSFTFFLSSQPTSKAAAALYHGSTDSVLLAISNMGFKPHLRIQNPVTASDKGQSNAWIGKAREVGADVKTYLFSFPMDEFKQLISAGIPVATSGSPCHADYNVLEGYSKDTLYAVIPDPGDIGRTEPEVSCPISRGDIHGMFWATPGGERKSDAELISKMKWLAELAPTNIRSYADFLEKGAEIANFEIGRFYLARKFAAIYFDELGYKELARGYEKSAELFGYLQTTIHPLDANKHRSEIITALRKIADHEECLYEKWPSPIVSKTTDYLEYGGVTITAKEEAPITIVSHKEEIPRGKLIYEVYDIETAKPLTLTFSYKEYQPANLIRGTLKVMKLVDGKTLELESTAKEADLTATISAEISESGKYALVLFNEPVD